MNLNVNYIRNGKTIQINILDNMNLKTLQEKMLEQAEIHGNAEDLVNACAKIAQQEITNHINNELLLFAKWCYNVGWTPKENNTWINAFQPNKTYTNQDVINRFTTYKKYHKTN